MRAARRSAPDAAGIASRARTGHAEPGPMPATVPAVAVRGSKRAGQVAVTGRVRCARVASLCRVIQQGNATARMGREAGAPDPLRPLASRVGTLGGRPHPLERRGAALDGLHGSLLRCRCPRVSALPASATGASAHPASVCVRVASPPPAMTVCASCLDEAASIDGRFPVFVGCPRVTDQWLDIGRRPPRGLRCARGCHCSMSRH